MKRWLYTSVAYKKIGSLEKAPGTGWGYFISYCATCSGKVVVTQEHAQEFFDAVSWRRQSILEILRNRLQYVLPRIRIVIERREGSRVLTNTFNGNTIESEINNMKIRTSQIAERTKKILEKRSTGLSIAELGKLFELSRQRIWAILKEYGDTLPKELSTDRDR